MEINISNLKINSINKTISASLTDDRIYFLVGKNGSGKTSVLKAIGGLIKTDSGEIYINNHSSNYETLRYKTYYLPEDCITTSTNIKVMDEIKSVSPSYNKNKLAEYIKLLRLNENILKRNMYELSYTEVKKVILMSMLLSKRQILLFDNIDTYLDQKSIDGLIKILKNIKREKKVIIISSNNTDLMLKVADSILVLNKNGIIKKEKKELLFNKKNLEQIDLKQPIIVELIQNIESKTDLKFSNRNIEDINDFIKEVYRNV